MNFEFLRPQYSAMADLAAFAETYAWSDPSSAAVKLRAFAELLTGAIYQRFRLLHPVENEFASRLNAPQFKSVVPLPIQNGLHGLRKEGNQAAHGGAVSSARALELIVDAFQSVALVVRRDEGASRGLPGTDPPYGLPGGLPVGFQGFQGLPGTDPPYGKQEIRLASNGTTHFSRNPPSLPHGSPKDSCLGCDGIQANRCQSKGGSSRVIPDFPGSEFPV